MAKGLRFKVEYEVIVRDKKGKVLQREKRISKSLLRAFMYFLLSKFTIDGVGTGAGHNYAVSWSTADTGNVSRTFPNTGALYEIAFGHFGAGVNADDRGLRVGTGTVAVTPTDYELNAKIAHGTGAGQMVYGAQTYEAIEIVGNTSRFRISRVFTNNSGASITVREIGGAFSQYDSGAVYRFILYLRDVLVSPSTVPDGASITVRYRFSVTA